MANPNLDAAASGVPSDRDRKVQARLDRLTRAGVVGVVATVTENGHTSTLVSGLADMETGAPMPANGQVRVGSVTKTFVSAILMQLVAEGSLELDRPVDVYLPGVVVGDGIDGRAITVRQILQHRSGLPEFSDDPRGDELAAAAEHRIETPSDMLALALSKHAQFAPGTAFRYTNTNYVVAGILVEQLTGNSLADELRRRILDPFGLTETYLPAPGETEIRGPHPTGYQNIGGTVVDVSRIEPSIPWAAGSLVSTGADLNRFFRQLADGNVVPPAQLTEMRAAEQPGNTLTGMRYGLGVGITELPCGITFIGHPGGIPGYYTLTGADDQGRAVTITQTQTPVMPPDLMGIMADALCPV
ncbi:serine hydrolase [Antrihabitans sp. YC2-6]|uniref:serine hydrolase domain-containing protein n=1 Tax=Antrihabitans sp. YC2-6 TaxID=2799498 RepID=UPI0018F6D11F|nr:serine hydrolase domain-containing protein [Antrihabitans sp. YC2-6]MBJ8348122.1 beta-lactamase family protein [Antrihabitans sp. YC2-6]